VTFSRFRVVATLGNIVIALGKWTIMDTLFVGLIGSSLETLLGHDGQHTSNIHNKFVLCLKNIILIALAVSHTCLYMEKSKKIQQRQEG